MSDYTALFLSDSPLQPTGFSNQSRAIAARLARDPRWNVYYLGAQYTGMPVKYQPDEHLLTQRNMEGAYTILPNGNQAYGADVLQTYIKKHAPDVLFVLLDTFMLYPWILNMDLSPAKFIMYFPSDGYPFPNQCENILKKANVRVAMSKYAQAQVADLFGMTDCRYIPHGVDTRKFYPLDNKEELRVKWSQRIGYDLRGKFIIGSVSRFQGRKMVPELIRAFQKFSEGKTEAVLLLHMDPTDPAGGQNILNLIRFLKIEHKVVFTGTRWFSGYTEDELREIYNLMDVHATGSSGEGFGIPVIESQACGVPNVQPDYTTMMELVSEPKAGLLARNAETIVGTWEVERGIVDKRELADCFTHLYENAGLRKELGFNARANALKYDMDFQVWPQWKKLFEEVVK